MFFGSIFDKKSPFYWQIIYFSHIFRETRKIVLFAKSMKMKTRKYD